MTTIIFIFLSKFKDYHWIKSTLCLKEIVFSRKEQLPYKDEHATRGQSWTGQWKSPRRLWTAHSFSRSYTNWNCGFTRKSHTLSCYRSFVDPWDSSKEPFSLWFVISEPATSLELIMKLKISWFLHDQRQSFFNQPHIKALKPPSTFSFNFFCLLAGIRNRVALVQWRATGKHKVSRTLVQHLMPGLIGRGRGGKGLHRKHSTESRTWSPEW